ncbi:MAG: hypothetical protein E7106_04675 [Prevotella sp.]|nr:hypothetical protein [Prevotella sp.]
MKKFNLWMLAAILTICGASVLTSCSSNDDNAVTPATPDGPGPLAETIEGLWWGFSVGEGTLNDGSLEYAAAIIAYRLSNDGTGMWQKIYLDDEGAPVWSYGEIDNESGNNAYGEINYTSAADGTIAVKIKHQKYYYDVPTEWQLRYNDGSITGTDNGNDYQLTPATEQMEKIISLYAEEVRHTGSDESTRDLAEDVADVKYEIIKDTAMWKFDILSNVYGAVMKDHDIEAELQKMRDEAEKPVRLKTATARAAAATRSVADPKVAWIPSGFRYIDYTYESVDEQGNPVTLSSRVCWGVNMGAGKHYFEFRPCDLVLCAHSTIADDLEAPTLGGSAETLMLQGDRVLILPDYIGYGVTKDRVHPYINHDLCARNCIDALKAGYKVFADKCGYPLHPDWKFYVIGASQGGGNALAIHKWLDTHEDFASRWRFQYSYCASGPYSPKITFEKYFEQKVLDYPIVLPLTLKAMFAAYPDILGKWKEEDFYSETYLQHKQDIDLMISSKEFQSGYINGEIFKMFPHTGETGIKPGEQIYMTDILNPEVCDMESEKCKALFRCFEKNDLTKGWTPIHPIHLYHGKSDTYVSYANSEAVMAAFPDKATLKEPTRLYSDHIKTCVLWMLSVAFGLW